MHQLKHVLLLLSWSDYRIHRGVAEVAHESGWQLICPKGRSGRAGLLRDWHGDGCITLLDSPETLENLRSRNIPVVDLGLSIRSTPLPRVVTDNNEIGRLAATHFLDRGYRNVFVCQAGPTPMFMERLNALRSHMHRLGGRVTLLQRKDSGSTALRELRAIASRRGLGLEEFPVAFFAYEDYRAAELISACLEQGVRIPENVAVLGVDNDDLINEGLAVGLSSIDSDQEGLGRAGAELLRTIFKDPDLAFKENLIRHPPLRVVARRSTDCYAVRNPVVAKALHWIHRNFRKGVCACDVARAMEMTQQGLQRAFSLHHIRTPGQEIRHQQAEAAADELTLNPNLNLTEITRICGYSSVDVLIRNFKKAYGTTPGTFRKQASQKRQSRRMGT